MLLYFIHATVKICIFWQELFSKSHNAGVVGSFNTARLSISPG